MKFAAGNAFHNILLQRLMFTRSVGSSEYILYEKEIYKTRLLTFA